MYGGAFFPTCQQIGRWQPQTSGLFRVFDLLQIAAPRPSHLHPTRLGLPVARGSSHQVAVRNVARTVGRQMKLVTAIIKPFKLNDVRESLSLLGARGMTVTEVKGC